MDLGIPGVRASARLMARSRMRGQCIVRRKSDGPGVKDEDTGQIVYPPPTVLYGPDIAPHKGACRIRMPYANAAVMVDAGSSIVMQQTHISFPADVVFERGDEVEILRSDNPATVGQKFTIRPLPLGEQQSANRYGIEAVH